jgi:Uma2 family endonuclease
MGAREYQEHYTYDDYKKWEGDWEIIDGYVYAMSPKPILRHQRIERKIEKEIENSICPRCEVLHEIDWKIKNDTVVSPDVVVVCGDDIGEAYLTKTPSIIYEILSPSTERKDRNQKHSLYEEYKVKYYTIVDGEKKEAEVYELIDDKYELVAKISTKKYTYDIDICKIEFDFSTIWAD